MVSDLKIEVYDPTPATIDWLNLVDTKGDHKLLLLTESTRNPNRNNSVLSVLCNNYCVFPSLLAFA